MENKNIRNTSSKNVLNLVQMYTFQEHFKSLLTETRKEFLDSILIDNGKEDVMETYKRR